MGFHVWITRLDTTPGANSEVHDHAPRAIFLHSKSVKMYIIVLGVSAQDPRDCGLQYHYFYQIFIFRLI